MQKLRLWWKGSQRRRDDFAATNATWASPSPPTPLPATRGEGRDYTPDRDGLQSAYLDQSGVILYYLDRESGEVVESREELRDPRYARVPTQNDAADRAAFIAEHGLDASAPFRETIARDRTLERAWYNFKTKRAGEAIEAWLRRSG